MAAAPPEPEPETCDRIAERAAEEREIELAQASAEEESAADDGGVADYGSNAIALIAARLQDQSDDPALRRQLGIAASQLALPDAAPLFAGGFIRALQSESDAAAKVCVEAVEQLEEIRIK